MRKLLLCQGLFGPAHSTRRTVTPAKAGIHATDPLSKIKSFKTWTPAFAGVTGFCATRFMRFFLIPAFASLLLAAPAWAGEKKAEKPASPVTAAPPSPEKAAAPEPLPVETEKPPAATGVPDTSSILFMQNLRRAGTTIYYLGPALGLDGWFAVKDGQVQIFYTTPGQKALIVGALLSPEGANISQQQILALANGRPEIQAILKGESMPAAASVPRQPVPQASAPSGGAEKFYAELLAGRTVTLGPPKAPRLVMIMDVNCHHCHNAWKKLAPLVDQGKLRVTLFPIAAMGAKSQMEGAAWLGLKDPVSAWKKYMAGDTEIFKDKMPAPEHMTALAGNTTLIQKWKVDHTPYLLYRGRSGKIRLVVGEPKSADVIMNDIGGG